MLEKEYTSSELEAMKVDYLNRLQNLTPEQIDFIDKKLCSKKWRMNNLYYIRDKNGSVVLMKLNRAQEKVLTKSKHNRKIILKSRQTGISTLYTADGLDTCIFVPGHQAGIQSYGEVESSKLMDKVELMWDRFDADIRKLLGIEIISNNANGIVLNNGSVLRIGNFRGDTLQSLHVSELAKIAKRFPDKAKELQTGAFEAVSINNKITVESTGEGPSGMFYNMCVKALEKQRLNIPLTPLDFDIVFINWLDDDDCKLTMEVAIPDRLNEYFTKIENYFNIKLDDEQKWWYAAKEDQLGILIKQEYPTFPEEAFEMSLEGAYYQREFNNLKTGTNLHNPKFKVIRAIDIGMSDLFVIGFFQVFNNGVPPVMIGEYKNNGEGFEFYTDLCNTLARKNGWVYGETYTPHDIKVKEIIAAKTRYDALIQLGWNPILVRRHSLADGIEDTRRMLQEITIDKNECKDSITAIQMYRKKYDKRFNLYLDAPEHDEHSHWADMLRYFAVGYRHYPIKNVLVTSKNTSQFYYSNINKFNRMDV